MMQTDPSQWKKSSVEEFTIQEMETMSNWVSICDKENKVRKNWLRTL